MISPSHFADMHAAKSSAAREIDATTTPRWCRVEFLSNALGASMAEFMPPVRSPEAFKWLVVVTDMLLNYVWIG